MRTSAKIFVGFVLLSMAAAGLVWHLNVRDEVDVDAPAASPAITDTLVARGAYLARAGNCIGCHTARGGDAYAGGLGIATPFGTVFTTNLTPDTATGIGSWSPAHFWRAMHNGRSKDGRLLYPAFPYTSYTQVTREDSDAIYAFLHSRPAVVQANLPNTLRFPYQSQAALAVWRALFFTPGAYQAEPQRDAEWNRGAYLVKGLGHCAACHSARNALGATDNLDMAGGLIPMQNWYAPSLASPFEAGVGDWNVAQITTLLKTGMTPHASVTGPMGEVVQNSTQYLNDADLGAMAQLLKTLQTSGENKPPVARPVTATPATRERAARLYENHCAQCHGDQGQGVAGAYPALAGNRAVTMASTVNLVQIVLNGGFAPSTQGNPRPYGMPPFVLVMDDSEIAAVLTHVRNSWGNQAGELTSLDVNRIRAAPGQ